MPVDDGNLHLMVDPAIEPIEHPGRHIRAGQQIAGAQDQIVEIQPAPHLFGLLIGGQEKLREIM